MAKPLCCHRCGSAELVLSETRYEHATYDEGLYLDETGAIRARGEGISAAGEIQPNLTEIECSACGHSWRPRRRFAGTLLGEEKTDG